MATLDKLCKIVNILSKHTQEATITGQWSWVAMQLLIKPVGAHFSGGA